MNSPGIRHFSHLSRSLSLCDHLSQKIIATKTTTVSESPGRQLSDGIPWIPIENFCIGVREAFKTNFW